MTMITMKTTFFLVLFATIISSGNYINKLSRKNLIYFKSSLVYCISFNYFFVFYIGFALKCMHCGEAGVCMPGVEPVSQECPVNDKSCLLSFSHGNTVGQHYCRTLFIFRCCTTSWGIDPMHCTTVPPRSSNFYTVHYTRIEESWKDLRGRPVGTTGAGANNVNVPRAPTGAHGTRRRANIPIRITQHPLAWGVTFRWNTFYPRLHDVQRVGRPIRNLLIRPKAGSNLYDFYRP
jgi:hypothetical protein